MSIASEQATQQYGKRRKFITKYFAIMQGAYEASKRNSLLGK